PPPLPRLTVPIPTAVLGEGTSLRLTLVNDGPRELSLRRVRLVEVVPTFSLSHFGLGGPFSPVSAGFLAAGPGLLLRARVLRAGIDAGGRSLRRALGPGLGLLILGLAVAAPAALRITPRWAWVLLILGVVPMGRRPSRPTTGHHSWAPRLARVAVNGCLVLVGLVIAVVAGELALRMVFRDESWARGVLRTPAPGPTRGESVNSLGFNEREVSLEKPPGVYRIAILGDSLSVSAPRG